MIRNANGREISPAELKTIQLDILDAVAEFCEARGIHYFLDSGTLLGAVRHKGYIPWDDDIDIAMPREDYDRFMKVFNSEQQRYRFCCPEIDPEFYYGYGKIVDPKTVLYEPDEDGKKTAVKDAAAESGLSVLLIRKDQSDRLPVRC